MTQKLIQTQEQKLQQLQRLSAQQMLQVKMLEMPLNELEDNINAELDDNPALETENPDDALMGEGNEDRSALDDSDNSNDDEFEDDAYEAQSEKKKERTNWIRHWKVSEKTTRCPTTILTDIIRRTPTTRKWFMAIQLPSTIS